MAVPNFMTADIEEIAHIMGYTSLAEYNTRVKEPAQKVYSIVDIEGKGKGMAATVKIAKGTRLLSEKALIRIPGATTGDVKIARLVAKELKKITPVERKAYHELANVNGDEPSEAWGIFTTNSFAISGRESFDAVFLEISRINHACRANAFFCWNRNIGKATIHALRDIEEGEEITISYEVKVQPYPARHAHMKEGYAFDCKCELCSLFPAERAKSDLHLSSIEYIDAAVRQYTIPQIKVPFGLKAMHTKINLLKEEGLFDNQMAEAYQYAYHMAGRESENRSQSIFAHRAYHIRRIIQGDDHPATMMMKWFYASAKATIDTSKNRGTMDEMQAYFDREQNKAFKHIMEDLPEEDEEKLFMLATE
jgi:hypothetical protein